MQRIRGVVVLASALLAVAMAAVPAHANRFGPPWMAIVTADQTTLYSSPDRSTSVGPLPKGAIVAVIATQADVTQTPDGWVASSDVAEAIQPWVAEVSDSSATLLAKPNAGEGGIRPVSQGDLVRVTGVSPGIDGDTGLYWATTDGYLGLHSIQSTTNPAAQQWTLPSAD